MRRNVTENNHLLKLLVLLFDNDMYNDRSFGRLITGGLPKYFLYLFIYLFIDR